MENKKSLMLLCGFRALVAYAVISFFWTAFVAVGTNDNSAVTISVFADRLVKANVMIAIFSAVYGFSLLIMRLAKLSSAAKYSLHILANYIAAMACAYGLFSNVNSEPTGWMVFILLMTVLFFVIYGLASLIIYLVKKHKA